MCGNVCNRLILELKQSETQDRKAYTKSNLGPRGGGAQMSWHICTSVTSFQRCNPTGLYQCCQTDTRSPCLPSGSAGLDRAMSLFEGATRRIVCLRPGREKQLRSEIQKEPELQWSRSVGQSLKPTRMVSPWPRWVGMDFGFSPSRVYFSGNGRIQMCISFCYIRSNNAGHQTGPVCVCVNGFFSYCCQHLPFVPHTLLRDLVLFEVSWSVPTDFTDSLKVSWSIIIFRHKYKFRKQFSALFKGLFSWGCWHRSRPLGGAVDEMFSFF